MTDKLQRIIDLANKTGDNVIVFDLNNGEPYVVLSLDKYETLAEKIQDPGYLTERAIADKINPEMASWENEPNFSAFGEYQEPPMSPEEEVENEDFGNRPLSDQGRDFEPIAQVLDRKLENNWQIPQERKQLAEDDEQYLEEITF